jgi:DNA-binding NarL/FixJ family response regulator
VTAAASGPAVRIMVVDDHAGIRQALRRLLTVGNWQVCAEAADGREAIDAAQAHNPDVVVMDVSMPHMSGLQAALEIREVCPDTPIVLVSAMELSEAEVRETGARGWLSKTALDRIGDVINAMLRGDEFHSVTPRPDRHG